MSRQSRRDTGPELALRSALHRRGLRYRIHRRPLPRLARVADIVFPTEHVAVFVDGCFWHGCEQHGKRRHNVNSWYWPAKIGRNRSRDADTDRRLHDAGWIAVRIWEHEDPHEAALRIAALVETRRPTAAPSPSSQTDHR
jgi:DNA mismatch endonuclease, patch repair protein